jgi:hypothetical protein
MGWVRGLAGGSGGILGIKKWLVAGISVAAAAAVTAGIIAAATGTSLWPFGHQQSVAVPQARHYLDTTACLLTDSRGIAPGTPGAPVWKAMQNASLATHVMVSYLPDTGRSDAAVMLSTLMERQCGVIITTGTPAAKVIKAAKADRQQNFVLVAASVPASPAGTPNTTIVSPAGAPARIDRAIRALASQARTAGS